MRSHIRNVAAIAMFLAWFALGASILMDYPVIGDGRTLAFVITGAAMVLLLVFTVREETDKE